ncbi:MAG TPA: ANTAR domain-containing protein, partial [Amycolatopsis sp.]|nr:ANTAR domain-containing protein [Amycolatopsis sp.]
MSTDQAAGVSANVARLAETVARLREEVDHAQAVADGRALIELAKGVLMERLQCAPADAARQLNLLAERAGLSPLELAADVVGDAAQDRISEVAREFLARAGEPRDPVALRLRTAESGVLSASDTQRVAESILEHALLPLGATAVAVWLAGPDGSFTLTGHAGFSVEEANRWRYVPPGVATPARSALIKREAVWYATLSASGLPSIGQHAFTAGGRVAVPTGTGGRIIGVVEMCWPGELPAASPHLKHQLDALAELCAHTLDTWDGPSVPAGAVETAAMAELVHLLDGLHDPALLLAPCVDEAGDFRIHHVNPRFADPGGRPQARILGTRLLETYPLMAENAGLLDKIQRVYATGEPFRTTNTTITALVDQVPLTALADIGISRVARCVVLTLKIQDDTAKLAVLLQHAQRLGRIGGFEENLSTGEITWNGELFALYGLQATARPLSLEQLPSHAHPDDGPDIGRFLRAVLHHRRAASTAFRLQRSDGVARQIRVVAEPVTDDKGQLLAVRGAYQDISAQHWTEVALAATRDRLARTEQQA